MGKNSKRIKPSAKEEKQGKKVLWIIGVSALILMVVLLVAGSLWSA
ncbi:MAG: hypothetical protein LBN06_07820 [Prevotellaceae bacterium]|jgi:hypothetical protein|nr:hypothetical protein [Prevotellaceae bacterium]